MTDVKEQRMQDRILGDEWIGWSGGGEESNLEEGKVLFLIFSFISLIIVIAMALIHWYLIAPRLEQFGPTVSKVSSWAILGFIVVVGLWSIAMIASALTEKNYFLFCGRQNMLITMNYLLPLALKLGQKLGYSKDRIGNSFVKVSNSLIRATVESSRRNLLILLPRCLRQDIRKGFMDLSKKYNFNLYTASGGTAARKIIAEKRPDAIIGIACERDLLSGIRDVAPRIPVLGIPNIRPEGPCKNTLVDMEEVERSIKFFMQHK